MNKDNLIEFAKEQCEIFPEDSYMGKYLRETLKMLQAEPCEKAISREDVIKAIDRHTFDTDDGLCLDEDISIILEELPPVKPAHKKGKWIDTTEISTNKRGQIVHEVICSECNGISYFRSMGNKYIGANLCPNCGSRNEVQ